ncbi:ABC transporter permease subunit [Enterococcus faecium]|uniref:ABC transporter permease subunit n=2 Tax=Enterococcus faecium TaxID=1352 RepID=UPI0020736818|nr:ABC transporter permease subunit [Enterococcus faecium]MCM6854835.1 ABC transporter permease subunit [Enterococcus faecium]MCM6867202.1 ABC transporter permease subunit [Enterococcus faecium]MCM6884716.1 ABC transporter permease subunit [Enterococcus faecium]MCM6898141.1 ABC transporter permease subunit [Enterococcus faecium]MCM6906200.1 ABC transporter permease subunit [Enterococcus faecium]
MRQLIAFAKKELKENWRTGKIITLSALTVIFGIMNPLLAKLTPYLVQALSTTLTESGISVQKITVDATTSWTQFYKNIPMLLIFFLLLFSGILTSEYQNGTIINLLTKGMKRWKIFLLKWIMGILFWSVSYWCCYSITLAYTIYYWDQSIISHPLFISFTYYFFGCWLYSLILFYSAFLSSNYAVLLASGGTVILSYGAGLFSKVAEYVPTYLISSSNFLAKEIHLTDYTQSLAVTCCSIVISIVAGWLIFNKKEV